MTPNEINWLLLCLKPESDFRRVAVITGKPLHRFMASMLKPFTSAEIKCFQQEKKSDALTWISHN